MNTERVRGNLPTVRRGDLRLLPRALPGRPSPKRNSFSRLWPTQISSHSWSAAGSSNYCPGS